MDFLKSAAKAAQEQVNELKQGALELAEDLTGYTEALVSTGGEDSKDLEFAEGPLGFRLEGTMVVSVEPGSQAERLGLECGDRLAAVAGYQVPDFVPDDLDAEQRATKMVKKWLKEMPRPSTLTFVSIPSLDDDSAAEALPAATPSGAAEAAARDPAPDAGAGADAGAAARAAAADVGAGGAGAAAGGAGAREVSPEPYAASNGATSESMRVLLRLAADWQQQGPLTEAALPAELQALQAELGREQEERRQLAAELQRTKHAWAQAKAGLEALKASSQRRVAELQAQLAAQRDESRKALLAVTAGEADSFTALEAAEARQQVLEETVAEMRQALDGARQGAAEAEARRVIETEELTARASSAERRAAEASQRNDALVQELHGCREAHEAELGLLRGERAAAERGHAADVRQWELRLAGEQERGERDLAAAKREVEDARRRLDDAAAQLSDAKGEAAAAALEAAAARMQAASSPMTPGARDMHLDAADSADAPLAPPSPMAPVPRGGSEDMLALYGRIDLLERRCSTLQSKLNARPVVFQNPQGSEMDDAELPGAARRPSWELSVVSVAGPRAGALAVAVYTAIDESLRRFTRRLLKRDAWLWMFYAHLVLLYAIAASSYAEISPLYDGSTADIQLRQQGVPGQSSGALAAPLVRGGAA